MSAKSHRKRRQAGAGRPDEEDGEMNEAGFDRWLNRRLHKIYDPVLQEPVPDDITRLLEGFASKTPDDAPPDDDH